MTEQNSSGNEYEIENEMINSVLNSSFNYLFDDTDETETSKISKESKTDFTDGYAQTDYKMIQESMYNSSSINKEYHEKAITNANKVIKHAMWVFTFVSVFICWLIGYIVWSDKDPASMGVIIPLIASFLAEVLSITIIGIMNTVVKSKDLLFESNTNSEKLSKMMGLVQTTINNEEFKYNLVEKLIDNFCENNKPK